MHTIRFFLLVRYIINLGWSIVHIEGSQIIVLKRSFSEYNFCFVLFVWSDPLRLGQQFFSHVEIGLPGLN